MKSTSKEDLLKSDPEAASTSDDKTTAYDSLLEEVDYILTPVEKKFLLTAERGDCAGVRR